MHFYGPASKRKQTVEVGVRVKHKGMPKATGKKPPRKAAQSPRTRSAAAGFGCDETASIGFAAASLVEELERQKRRQILKDGTLVGRDASGKVTHAKRPMADMATAIAVVEAAAVAEEEESAMTTMKARPWDLCPRCDEQTCNRSARIALSKDAGPIPCNLCDAQLGEGEFLYNCRLCNFGACRS